MTDPLGQSQVLPYVFGLKKRGYEFHLISFEKMDRYQLHHRTIQELFKENDVHWHPQDYQLSGGIKTTLKQVRRMHKVAKYLHELHQFDIVHCRSYMPALTGLKMKRADARASRSSKGIKFIFDMRGFWADERIDGKLWSLDSPIFKRIYNYFKRKETQFLLESDYSIIGTQNGYDEMHTWKSIQGKNPKVKVIPCCANLDLFDPSKIATSDQEALRTQLGIKQDHFVLGYVGSIGTWYMLSEMLDYFKCLKTENPKAIFLFVSGEKPEYIKGEAEKKGIDPNSILVTSTLHSGVPLHLSLFDVAIFFIIPSYSKKAASPVKQGEIMAMGIPLICNSGVGDTDSIVIKYKAGTVINELNDETYRANFIQKEMFDSQEIMDGAKAYFSLEEGLNQYEWIYKKSLSKRFVIIAPYPKGEAPSQRFRFEQYLDFFEEQGYTIEFHAFLSDKTWKALYKEGSFFAKAFGMMGSFWRRLVLMFKLKSADVIFIHREASMIGPPMFEWFIAKILRKKFIYDFDDAIWLPNYSDSNARFQRLKAYGKVKRIMKWAHIVSAGNQHLLEFAEQYNSNVRIIPTTIDLENVHTLATNQAVEKPIIGWTGTHTTMNYLDEIVPILRDLEDTHDFVFRVISNQAPSFELKSLEFVKWNKESEIEDLAKINIGVMPLTDTIWAKGKCGFKGLQYMALEIPSVMSPVGVNTSIVKDGKNGFLPNSPEEWKQTLINLLDSEALRIEIGKAGKRTVKESFSVEANRTNCMNLLKT